MLQTKNKRVIFTALLACSALFTGCAALDAPIHERFTSNDCNLSNIKETAEAYHIRFEVVGNEQDSLPGVVHLENTTMLESGSESLVFSGNTTSIQRGYSNESQVWVLASLGQNQEGNICLKTRTATRPAGLSGEEASDQTLLSEEVYDIELVGACGEAILETQLPGVGNAKLRISSAPRSTAEYLNNPEQALNSSCAQVVDSLTPEQGIQFRAELKTALGV